MTVDFSNVPKWAILLGAIALVLVVSSILVLINWIAGV